jgi:cob(I)alamin adenosyltransferase
MKIYTKTGDDGTTGLFGGGRVSKADPRIECYGTIDELNASLGVAAVCATGTGAELRAKLRQVQNELFVIGSHLATPDDSRHRSALPALDERTIARLEQEIDQFEERVPALRTFILPGGTELSARLHVARTICRRAERLLVGLTQFGDQEFCVKYLNRLSDWLFVAARWANAAENIEDIAWVK